MRRQLLKKICTLILTATLIVPQQSSCILASNVTNTYASIKQSVETPDYDYWMAQTLMHGIDNKGNSLYSTFQSLSEPVYQQLGGYLLDDKPLVSISTAWSIYFNSEYRNQLTNVQKYIYEILLMDYIKYDILGEDKDKELTNNKTDFALEIYEAIGKEISNNKKGYIDKMPLKESLEVCRRIDEIDSMQYALKSVKDSIKTTKELIDALSEYLAVLKVKDDCVALLNTVRLQVPIDGDFKKAITEIYNTINGTPVEYIKKKSRRYLLNKALDKVWSEMEDINPVLKAIDWGTSGLDICFNSEKRASNDLKLALLYTTDCYMRQGMLKAADDFRNNSNSKTGENFVYCFNAYIKFQMYANSYATTWLKDYLKGGEISDIANWIYHKENVSTATELINVCKRQNKYRQSLMDNESKYVGIYFSKYEIDDEEVIPTGRQSSITINKGKTKKFVIDNVLTGAKIIYSSSNNKVAYADSKGVIKGVKSGTATITAQITQNKKKYHVKINVNVKGYEIAGTCGENIKWTYIPEKNKLVISGKGAMRDYKDNRTGLVNTPWGKYKNRIYEIEVKNGVTEISNYAFDGHMNVKSIKMADSIKKIGYSAFYACKGLKAIQLSKNISCIDEYTFCHCESLEKITIPRNVKYILNAAFSGCINLEKISLPENLEFIGTAVFSGCFKLHKLVFTSSLKKMDWGIFQNSRNIKEIYFKGNFPQINEGIFFNSDMKVTIYYPTKKNSWKNKKNKYVGAEILWKQWNP